MKVITSASEYAAQLVNTIQGSVVTEAKSFEVKLTLNGKESLLFKDTSLQWISRQMGEYAYCHKMVTEDGTQAFSTEEKNMSIKFGWTY